MHRAYHAVQTPMTAKDGTPTNAVFGFLTMLCKFIEMASPDAVVCAFDAGKPVHSGRPWTRSCTCSFPSFRSCSSPWPSPW